MTDIPEMARKYAELMETPVDRATVNENGESLSTLCQSEWVRILVIRRPSTPDLVTIEVEISLPSPVVRTSDADGADSKAKDNGTDLLHQAIEHLHYLSRLRNNGFTLDVVGQECLWTAFRDFTETPVSDVFDLLKPPTGCGQRAKENPSVIPPFRYTI
ncbi:MAG: hypothetical protein JSW05_01690 [Candidatus Thorarchaeota archaeon]|nr:MAG: hypothetical protein JSW05_01690 [Candidatus Thorarchaeota archaeon]